MAECGVVNGEGGGGSHALHRPRPCIARCRQCSLQLAGLLSIKYPLPPPHCLSYAPHTLHNMLRAAFSLSRYKRFLHGYTLLFYAMTTLLCLHFIVDFGRVSIKGCLHCCDLTMDHSIILINSNINWEWTRMLGSYSLLSKDY